MKLPLLSLLSLIACGVPDGPVQWDCTCDQQATDLETNATYEDDEPFELCLSEEDVDAALDQAAKDCTADLKAAGFESGWCSCWCTSDWKSCEK